MKRKENGFENHFHQSEKECLAPSNVGKLYSLKSVPSWLQFNKFILHGYRAQLTTQECLSSLLHLHNETVNIYSHGKQIFPSVYFLNVSCGHFQDQGTLKETSFKLNSFVYLIILKLGEFINIKFPHRLYFCSCLKLFIFYSPVIIFSRQFSFVHCLSFQCQLSCFSSYDAVGNIA